jgi:hypothetical protein
MPPSDMSRGTTGERLSSSLGRRRSACRGGFCAGSGSTLDERRLVVDIAKENMLKFVMVVNPLAMVVSVRVVSEREMPLREPALLAFDMDPHVPRFESVSLP